MSRIRLPSRRARGRLLWAAAALALVLAAAALGRAAEKSELLRALVFGDSDWEDEEVDSLRTALDLLGPVREHLS